jgi:hypothetical protein
MADPVDDEAGHARTDLTRLTGGLPVEASMHPAGTGRSRWAQQELGDLLGPSWLDDAAPAQPDAAVPMTVTSVATPVEPGPSGAIWEVERMPSEAEGGVVGLLLSGRRDDAPQTDAPADQSAALPPSGMARLTEMLDHLPAGAVARVTPDDVDVYTADPAPPAVWFWGDDDIYPGKMPGVVEARPAPKRRHRRSA